MFYYNIMKCFINISLNLMRTLIIRIYSYLNFSYEEMNAQKG